MSRRARWLRSLLIFLAVLGPGIVTGSVDNDVGGITTYSVAGAMYGFHYIWSLFPCAVVLFLVQEMNARMGIVTGKGLADLIRENAGVKITALIFAGLLLADLANTTTEFAGVAGSMDIFGVSKYIAVPISAIGVWFLVAKGTYKMAERIFLVFSLFLLSYVVSAVMGHPDWGEVARAVVHPKLQTDTAYIALGIGLVGTTIAPWMQFYMQSAVIEKGLKIEDYRYTLADVAVGCFLTIIVAFFIMVACGSTLHVHGVVINDAGDAAKALQPLAGRLSSYIFAAGLFVAAIFSATILPVATAFYVCEAFGFEAGIDKTPAQAPQFYALFTAILAVGAGIILIPNAPLIKISVWSQIVNGLLFPVVLICIMILINNKEIMGKYKNGLVANIIGWTASVVLSGMSLWLVVSGLLGG